MSDDIPLFRVDKEVMVIELYRQGKRIKEIASIVRMNFSDIKTIIDREFGSKQEKNKAKAESGTYSQALKLFIGGGKPVTVSMKLGLGYDEVRKIYLQFLNLNRMYRLKEIYDEIGRGMKSIISLHYKMKENNFTIEQVQNAIKLVNSLSELEERRSVLYNDVNELKLRNEELISLNSMQLNQIELGKSELKFYNNECELKAAELSALNSEANSKKKLIQDFDNDKRLIKIKEAAKNEVGLLLKNKSALITTTIVAALEAFRLYPINQEILFNLLTSNYELSGESWMESHKLELIRLSEFVQNDILEKVSKAAVEQFRNFT